MLTLHASGDLESQRSLSVLVSSRNGEGYFRSIDVLDGIAAHFLNVRSTDYGRVAISMRLYRLLYTVPII